MQYFLKSQVNKGWRFCLIGSFSLRWPRLRFHYFPEKLARFRIRLTSFSFFLRSQVNKYGHFCLIGSFSLRCASTSFSRFARRISTISHSPNLCFPSFEVKIFQLTWKGGISYIPWCIASYYITKLPNARDPISSHEFNRDATVEQRWKATCFAAKTFCTFAVSIYLRFSFYYSKYISC